MKDLIEKPEFAQRLGENGRQRARLFTWDKSGERLEEVYKGLLFCLGESIK